MFVQGLDYTMHRLNDASSKKLKQYKKKRKREPKWYLYIDLENKHKKRKRWVCRQNYDAAVVPSKNQHSLLHSNAYFSEY